MHNILSFFQLQNLSSNHSWIAFGILLVELLVLCLICRFLLGLKSILSSALSSAFAIILIYVLAAILYSHIHRFDFVVPLPFSSIDNRSLHFPDFFHSHYTVLSANLLGMIALAFLVNLADCIFPKKKNLFVWLLFRILTVITGYISYLLIMWLVTAYLPDGIAVYAPMILISVLLLALLTGISKFLTGALISTVNPIVGALYAFFFANIIGRQITKSVLTTAIVAGLIIALRYVGVTAFSICTATLIACLPLLLLMVAMWYLFCNTRN